MKIETHTETSHKFTFDDADIPEGLSYNDTSKFILNFAKTYLIERGFKLNGRGQHFNGYRKNDPQTGGPENAQSATVTLCSD